MSDVIVKGIKPIVVNGTAYYTSSQLSHIIGRSENMVYRLINHGNYFRKMKCTKDYLNRPLIPVSELTEFPFTGPGRYPQYDVFHFDVQGKAYACPLCSIDGEGACRR